jgi:hypothetical protein
MTRQAKGRLLLCAALFCSILIYARTIRFNFVYDDWGQIVRNTHLTSAAFIPTYFTADVWSQAHDAGQGRYYRPVFLLWLLLNRTLFGTSPASWHATSLLLELLAIFLLYIVCTKVLKDPVGGGIAALLFAVHPANLESVAWVSCASELLMGVLLLLAFFLYLRFRAGGHNMNLAVSAMLFGIALGTKETAIAFLPILIWHEWCCVPCVNHHRHGLFISKLRALPILPFAFYFLSVLFYVLFRTTAMVNNTFGPEREVTFAVGILTVPSAMIFYLRHLIFPSGLAAFYEVSYTRTIFSSDFALSLLIVVLAGCFLWALCRRIPAARTALGWIVVPLLPPLAALGTFAHGDLVHDRYLYLSTMGLAMLVSAVVINVTGSGWEQRLKQILPFVAAGTLLWMSTTQLGYWKDNLTLYQHSAEQSPRSTLALNSLANERFRENDLTGALGSYQSSLAVDPNLWATNMALALTFIAAHEDAQALHYYSRAIIIDPQKTDPYALVEMMEGHENLYVDAGQTGIPGFPITKKMAQLHFGLGSLLERSGDFAGARVQYERTLTLEPGQEAAASRMSSLALSKPAS